jgi:hypothetical protein
MRVAIWGYAEARAAKAARAMGFHDDRIILVGNRSTAKLRGLTIDVLIVLPGADPRHDAEVRPAVIRGAFVDLRDVTR